MSLADRRDFDGEPDDVRGVRQFVGDTLARWGLSALVADGVLIASELATNAVIHAHSSFAVSLDRIRGGVVVAVSDQDPRDPSLQPVATGAKGGRGMHLVKALSKACGVRQVPHDGKTVWAALSNNRERGPASSAGEPPRTEA
jgi:anti-sigma regulatory factor (Ser/Thr protein kinase)